MEEIDEGFKVDPDAWALIMTGAGDKAFSAGADLDEAIGAGISGEVKR